ncbi:MAG: putative sensory box protein [Acidimicrobiia bacterium]|nr:putative sensory box protein [Acidimicrobiia bacterium]
MCFAFLVADSRATPLDRPHKAQLERSIPQHVAISDDQVQVATGVRQRAAQQAEFLWEHTPDVSLLCRPDGTISECNPAGRRLGSPRHIRELLGDTWQHTFVFEIVAWLRHERVWTGQLELTLSEGPPLYWSATAVGVYDDHDELTELLLVGHDVTKQTLRIAHLTHLATHDGLTGLPNRTSFLERLRGSMMVRSRMDRPLVVILADVDRFKLINDSLGHELGDELLASVAHRLRDLARTHDVVARVGANQFAVLCESVSDDKIAVVLAERIRLGLAHPLWVDERAVPISVSVGVATASDSSAERVLRNADTAMLEAKQTGRNRTVQFDHTLAHRVEQRLAMEHALRRALELDELSLVYQPQFALSNNTVVGAEALVRWNSPVLGSVSPAEFIPVAEDTGLIIGIGRWVLHHACHEAARWHEVNPAAAEMDVHVNLSPRQFLQPDLGDMVERALQASGLAPHRLCLEITETAVMHDINLALATLTSLRRLGVRVALDDFGVGHSSLSYLRSLPVDVLKLDKSFIDRLGQDQRDADIVTAVINLARALGLSVVAEGIETEEQRRILRSLGCTLAQGFLFSRPLPPEEFLERIRTRSPEAVAVAVAVG